MTFRRTTTEVGLSYSALNFQAAFPIDIRERQGDRSMRSHFQTVRVRPAASVPASGGIARPGGRLVPHTNAGGCCIAGVGGAGGVDAG